MRRCGGGVSTHHVARGEAETRGKRRADEATECGEGADREEGAAMVNGPMRVAQGFLGLLKLAKREKVAWTGIGRLSAVHTLPEAQAAIEAAAEGGVSDGRSTGQSCRSRNA